MGPSLYRPGVGLIPGLGGQRKRHLRNRNRNAVTKYKLYQEVKAHWYNQLHVEMIKAQIKQYRLMCANQKESGAGLSKGRARVAKMSTGKPPRFNPRRLPDRSYIKEVQEDDDQDDKQRWKFDFQEDTPKAGQVLQWKLDRIRPELEDTRKVKQILDKGFIKGEPYYLIKWEGDPEHSLGSWVVWDRFMRRNLYCLMNFDRVWEREAAKKKVVPYQFPKEIIDRFLKEDF